MSKKDNLTQALEFLGGVSAEDFMREYWQKKVLLARNAQQGFRVHLSNSERQPYSHQECEEILAALELELDDVLELAENEDVESRLEWLEDEEWQAQEGPFEQDLTVHFDGSAADLFQASTLYVHGLNLQHAGVAALARQFRFIPMARFEEVAINYAAAGAYVAPNLQQAAHGLSSTCNQVTHRHSEGSQAGIVQASMSSQVSAAHTSKSAQAAQSYTFLGAGSKDLFILQLQGQRAYRIGHVAYEVNGFDDQCNDQSNDQSQGPRDDQSIGRDDGAIGAGLEANIDKHLDDNLETIEKSFNIESEFMVQPGDLVYLPAHITYDSVALSEHNMCMVFSFSSLGQADLARGLLEVALDQVSAQAEIDSGLYSNPAIPGIVPTEMRQNLVHSDAEQVAITQSAAIPEAMLQAALSALQQVQFNKVLAARFIGAYLTEPDASAEFPMPKEELDWPDFSPDGKLILNLKSRMLYYADELYINGETIAQTHAILQDFADQGRIRISQVLAAPEDIQDLLLQWIDDGWIYYQG